MKQTTNKSIEFLIAALGLIGLAFHEPYYALVLLVAFVAVQLGN